MYSDHQGFVLHNVTSRAGLFEGGRAVNKGR